MNVTLIRSLVLRHSGAPAQSLGRTDLGTLATCLQDAALATYLQECLPVRSYVASGLSFHSLGRILDELQGAPGESLYPWGYLPIASSIGGNAVVVYFRPSTGTRVFWADHDGWYETFITYKDRQTGQWIDLAGYSPVHVERALVPIGNDLGAFLQGALADQLTDVLAVLDH